MNNFGVIEIATTKTTNAPGWAYVPDTGPVPAAVALQQHPTNRKRGARNQAAAGGLSHADANARQEAKVRRELEILDRDNYHRDANIPIPPKPGGGGSSSRTVGAAQANKHTPNVRRILQSQKTFANHLDDFEAMLAHADGGGGAGVSASAAASAGVSGCTSSRRAAAAAAATQKGAAADRGTPRAAPAAPAVKSEDVEMRDADVDEGTPSSRYLQPPAHPPPPPHPGDDDPLLASRVPPVPMDEELRALLAAPPLSYVEARAGWTEEDQRYPVRVFCEVCGYWGRVRCMKCGVRVCALDCLETHREECITRYGL
ncbi:hypothetical protein DL770_009423 [Monosporascus sp. CRB-9-2]|nr:hypothetical protein DL770_009423 [Monosporascus sp. CRB-9-2]